MRRALPRRSAEIQTCFIMYPWQASLPRGRKGEKKHSAAGEQRACFTYQVYICVSGFFIIYTRYVRITRSGPKSRVIKCEYNTRWRGISSTHGKRTVSQRVTQPTHQILQHFESAHAHRPERLHCPCRYSLSVTLPNISSNTSLSAHTLTNSCTPANLQCLEQSLPQPTIS